MLITKYLLSTFNLARKCLICTSTQNSPLLEPVTSSVNQLRTNIRTNEKNKSPLHFLNDHLAIESWCVLYVYKYAAERLKEKIANNDELDKLLTGILLLNPDVPLYWNMRRKNLAINHQLELRLTQMVLSWKSTSLEAFNHRKWVIISRGFNDFTFLEDEMTILRSLVDKSPNNYHAWQYAKTLISYFLINNNFSNKCAQHFLDQWCYSERWMESHVSDYSAIVYRQYLIRTIFIKKYYELISSTYIKPVLEKFNLLTHPISEFSKALGFLLYELDNNNKLIIFFSGVEALWHHRRFIIYLFNWMASRYCKYTGQKFDKWKKCSNLKSFSELNSISLDMSFDEQPLMHEFFIRFPKVESQLMDNINLDICERQEQMRLQKEHKNWLKNFIGMEL